MEKEIIVNVPVKISIPEKTVGRCLKSYQAVIDGNGELSDMLEHIAFNVAVNGQSHFIEGIGPVSWREKKESPVVVYLDRDNVEFEVDQ